MKIPRWTLGGLLAIALAFATPTLLSAQGVTTGAISGTVIDDHGQPAAAVQISVLNISTGSRTSAQTNNDGRYYVPGLEVGGPYSVTARRLGYAPQTKTGLDVALSQNLRVDFTLITAATQLAAVTTAASSEDAIMSSSHTGIAMTVTDSMVSRLPTLSRNFTDYLRLSPDVTTKGPGNSGGGQNNRFNAIQIDGSVATDLFGLGSTGQPGGQANAKQIPLGAVKEYQVVLAPYDVRQGNFTGVLVNAVTKSGTNDVHGEIIGNYRDQYFERDIPYLRSAPFKQDQYGFSLGGPIIRDRIQYFFSGEVQNESTPATGPYVGQPSSSSSLVADTASITKFINTLVNQYGYKNPGNGAQVTDGNPLHNFFGRFDFANLPANSRAVLRYNYAQGNLDVFSRSNSAFGLSNDGYNFNSKTNNELLQLFSDFTNGASNEFIGGYTTIRDHRDVPIWAPYVTVKNIPLLNGTGTTSLVAGTDNSSQGNQTDQDIFELSDNVSIPWQDHVFTIGTKNDFYKVRNLFAQNSLGNYTFGSLDSLALGLPDKVVIGKRFPDNTPDGAAEWRAQILGLYAGDQWQALPSLSLNYGIRVDVPSFLSHPGTNQTILSTLGINTADMPKNNAQWSPRLGFNWDVTPDNKNQLRGGTGIFMGNPAFVWLSDAYGNSGVNGFANFTCSNAATSPAFPGATGAVPQTCANGSASQPVTINTVDPKLQFPSVWRSSLGFDRQLPWGVIGTLEGQYTKSVEQFYYENIGLQNNPIGTDLHGRALYGDIVGGSVKPTYKTGLSDVINLTNETGPNKDYSYALTAQLQKRFSDAFAGSFSYTYSRSYDIYDVTSSVAYSNWQYGRDYSGRQDAEQLAPSKWDIPHRLVFSGTYSLPTHTDLSFIFTGESGAPYTYIYSGDMNGDGSANNDPVYVPKSTTSTSEIMFATNGAVTVAQQQQALQNLINSTPCLNSQRGEIMARNSCRFPWTKELDLSLRQSVHTFASGQNLVLEWDCFNFLNLLNSRWGSQDFGLSGTNDPYLLTQKSFSGTSLANGAQGVFTYNTSFAVNSTQNATSNYRMQLQVKYTF